jgi:peroxiredoxin Q/BCP
LRLIAQAFVLPGKNVVNEGTLAPSFALKDQDGKLVKLRDFRGRTVVLFFYVRDDTPGCTKEACSFRDSIDILRKNNVVVLGVSPDSSESHQRFAEKHSIPFPLLVDERAALAKKFGVWGKKNMYGRKFFGVIRSTFIIDGHGRIQRVYRRVKVDDHLNKIIRDLKQG